jgi:hypothetical protein
MFLGRNRELGALRSAFDAREASVTTISGPVGVGKTALVRQVARNVASVVHRCPPLPDPSQRAALASALRRALPGLGRDDPSLAADTPDWPELLDAVARSAPASGGPLLLVLDDAHHLKEARSRIRPALAGLMADCRAQGRPVHVLLAGRAGGLPAVPEDTGAGLDVPLAPLPFRAALPLLPGTLPKEKVESYGAFGGSPGTLRHLDTAATLMSNVRRLLLSPDAGLADAGTVLLERHLQRPSRYAAILAALSRGEAEWGTIHAGVSDLTTSGQVAPYLQRLEELGLIEVERSLDARPRSRNRRYRITDPFLAFWYRVAVSTGWRQPNGAPTLDAGPVRALVQAQASAVFPQVCRQYMRHDAMELLGQNARECGGLWGAHYDMEVSGILTSGAAFYGTACWPDAAGLPHLRGLDAGVRETRYGFGRENRLRMVFTAADATAQLSRAAARRHDVVLVTPAQLAGH